MSQIFISYKRQDKDVVFPIVEEIKQKTGVDCWIDLEGIESGDQFQNVIIDAIDNADIVVFMLSKNFIAPYKDEITGEIDLKKQTFPEKEVMYALRHDKRLVPISIDGTTIYDCKWLEFNCAGIDGIDWNDEQQKSKIMHWSESGYTPSVRSVKTDAKTEKLKPQMIDLGLNVLWATSNLGSNEENIQGEYYAWGDISPKEFYTKDNCMTEGKIDADLQSIHIVDGKTNSLSSEQDVVHKLYGDGYRLPTRDDILELSSKCTFLWTEDNGVKGYIVNGPNNQSIFLPVTGYKQGRTVFNCKSAGYYWSSNNCIDSKYSYALFFDEQNIDPIADTRRFHGVAIRPVLDKKSNTSIPIPIGEYRLEVTWQGEDDLDMVAFLLNQDGNISDEADFVFYNSGNRTDKFDKSIYSSRRCWRESTAPMSLDGSTMGEPIDWMCDEGKKKAMMTLDLNKVREEITEIVFGLSVYQDYAISSKEMTLHVYDNNSFDIKTAITGMAGKSSLIICSFIKDKDNSWFFLSSAVYFNGGMQALINKYT